jgi:Peptidase family M28
MTAQFLPLLISLILPSSHGFLSSQDAASRPAISSEASSTAISAKSAETTVRHLASKDFRGRRAGSKNCSRAAAWVAQQLQALELEPGNKGSWFHEFPLPRDLVGKNVIGILKPTKPARDYIVIGCHHDGQGAVNDKVFKPSADDNASGVAAMLMLAEHFTGHRDELTVNLAFVSFDAEEMGLIGSRYFVAREVLPVDRIRFMMVFDLLGGRFFPWDKPRLFVMGSEYSDAVRAIADKQRKKRPMGVDLLGTYVLEPVGAIAARSDYAAFRKERIPYLFLSTATPWYYHTIHDTPDIVDYDLVANNTSYAADVLLDLARQKERAVFKRKPQTYIQEAQVMLRGVQGYLDHAKNIKLPEKAQKIFQQHKEALTKIITKGKISSRDARAVQKALVSCFQWISHTKKYKR